MSAILARAPVAEVISAATREAVSSALWRVVSAATEEALRRIHDPRTKAGELAQLLKVAADQHALLEGQPNWRTETTEAEQPATEQEMAARRSLAAKFDAWLALGEDEQLEHAAEMLRIVAASEYITQSVLAGDKSLDELRDELEVHR